VAIMGRRAYARVSALDELKVWYPPALMPNWSSVATLRVEQAVLVSIGEVGSVIEVINLYIENTAHM
jgi:hypothetical protein